MPEPQAVLAPLTESAVFLTLALEAGGEAVVHDVLSDIAGMTRSVAFRLPEEALTCVVGIGSAAWDRLFDGPRPAGLRPFREITGERHHAPATPGDLFLHIRAGRTYPCFELARRIVVAFGPAVTVVDEVQGFRYFDRRDLLGFVDGTENPTGAAAAGAVLVGDHDPDFAGGSYLVVQKYLHDLDTWNAMTVDDRELAIGRRMLDDVELDDETKPADSHVALTNIEGPDGTERQILRDNMPFGSIARGEFGTYFAGYVSDPRVIELMLTRMFVGAPPGRSDRILEVSRAVTGGMFFVPSADFLENSPPLPQQASIAEPGRVAEPVVGRPDVGVAGLR